MGILNATRSWLVLPPMHTGWFGMKWVIVSPAIMGRVSAYVVLILGTLSAIIVLGQSKDANEQ